MPLNRPATWDDLLDVPEQYIGEIVDGKLIMSPRPNPPHADAASSLGGLLMGPFQFQVGGPGGWRIIHEPRVAFGNDIRVPDLAGWRDRRYELPERGPYTVIPDWIGEVLSPGTERIDRTEKLELYRKHGVSHVWLIDPKAHTIEIYRARRTDWLNVRMFTEAVKVQAEPFEAIALDLALLWPPS